MHYVYLNHEIVGSIRIEFIDIRCVDVLGWAVLTWVADYLMDVFGQEREVWNYIGVMSLRSIELLWVVTELLWLIVGLAISAKSFGPIL